MSAQHLRVIAIAVAVLLLLWGGSTLFSRGSDRVTGGFVLPPVGAQVDTIAIVKGVDAIVLARQSATAWTVNGHRAAPAGVSELFAALKDSVRPELVAQDSSSFARLGVDSARGRWLRLRSGARVLLRLIVGGSGPGFQSAYVRRPGESQVYLWRGRLPGMVDRTLDEWRDKQIAALAPESITALVVARGKDHYTLARRSRHWVVNGGATDSGAVARYLERLRTIQAAGFATPQAVDSTRGRRASRQLTVRGSAESAGGVLVALAFDSMPGGFLVRHLAGRGGEGATIYRMNVWDVDGLTPTSHSLAPPPHKS